MEKRNLNKQRLLSMNSAIRGNKLKKLDIKKIIKAMISPKKNIQIQRQDKK